MPSVLMLLFYWDCMHKMLVKSINFNRCTGSRYSIHCSHTPPTFPLNTYNYVYRKEVTSSIIFFFLWRKGKGASAIFFLDYMKKFATPSWQVGKNNNIEL